MAAPNYTNDLVTIATGDLNFDAGTWDESSDAGWDTAGAMVDDTNLQYATNSVNTGEAADSCTSAQYTKIGTGSGAAGPGTIMYQHTAAFVVPTDGVILAHSLWAAPLALNIFAGTFLTAEAGVSFLIGDTFGVFDVHYVSGSDKIPAPEGGWATYAVDPTIAPDGSVGAPTTTRCVGIAIAATAQARGNPQAMQYIRYGRGEQEYTLGEIANPATFEGYAIIDNAAADRFNLLKYLGNGYSARGLMTFGTAATAVYFEDSDKSITIADDPKVGVNFNQGVVNNVGSVLKWTNIAISNLSSVAKYKFTVNDLATTEHKGCVFTDLGAFNYGSNSTNIGTTYRRQELVSQLGATFTGCTFDKSVATVALLVSNLNIVTDCDFNSDATGHAVDLGNVASNLGVTWDNVLTSIASEWTGSAGTTVGIAGTANDAIVVDVDSGITLTINVSDTATIPTVQNLGLGTVVIVAGQKSFKFTLSPSLLNYEWRIYTVTALGSLNGAVEVDGEESATADNQTYNYTYSVDQPIAVQIINQPDNDYEEKVVYFTLVNSNQDVTINLNADNNN